MSCKCQAMSGAAISYRSIKFAFVAAYLLAFKAYSSDFLPQGWTTHSSNGVAYYYNRNTGTTQWEKPILGTNPHQFTGASQSPKLTAESLNSIQHASQNGLESRAESLKPEVCAAQNSLESIQNSEVINQNRSATDECIEIAFQSNSTQERLKSHQQSSTSPDETCIISDGATHEDIAVGSLDMKSGEVGKVPVTNLDNDTLSHGETSSHLNSLPFVSKLREADLIIDQLNEKIDNLEEEKAKLLLRISEMDGVRANYTVSVEATILSTAEQHSSALAELELRVTTLDSSLANLNEELEALRAEKISLEEELNLVISTTNVTSSYHLELKSNFSLQVTELKSSKELLTQQEKELADAYKEIGQLEEDMRNVAEPSLRRLRQPSIISRILERIFPVWVGGKGSVKSGRRAKGRAAALSAALETALAMNRTVESLRENLTAMASLLDNKESSIEELSEQLAEGIEEADKRREAYIVLKDGVDNLQEENIRLLEDLESRDVQIFELSSQLNATIYSNDYGQEQLNNAQMELASIQDNLGSHSSAHEAMLARLEEDLSIAKNECNLKDMLIIDLSSSLQTALQIENELQGQVGNMTTHLNDLLMRQQAVAKIIVEESLVSTVSRPWFWSLWPF